MCGQPMLHDSHRLCGLLLDQSDRKKVRLFQKNLFPLPQHTKVAWLQRISFLFCLPETCLLAPRFLPNHKIVTPEREGFYKHIPQHT